MDSSESTRSENALGHSRIVLVPRLAEGGEQRERMQAGAALRRPVSVDRHLQNKKMRFVDLYQLSGSLNERRYKPNISPHRFRLSGDAQQGLSLTSRSATNTNTQPPSEATAWISPACLYFECTPKSNCHAMTTRLLLGTDTPMKGRGRRFRVGDKFSKSGW
jgi:hypothetical protein